MQSFRLMAAAAAKGMQRRGVMGVPAMKDVVLPNREEHAATLIFMHGLGDTGAGWEEPMRVMSSAMPSLKIVLPSAPELPVTLNGGMLMPAWYDIAGLGSRANERCTGIDESAKRITELVSSEMDAAGQSGKVLLCGFSQGGAMALYTGLHMSDPRIAGIGALSSYLPCPSKFTERAQQRKDIPLLMCHGAQDGVVHLKWAEESRDTMQESGYTVDFNTYEGMDHELNPHEFQKFVQWAKASIQ
eukprot:TRINITY_DN4958_c1_g2_i1.p2 TRINITY_DN4958_c1_g2~~TRINITY_DN4958_c1_g2_i1.p2  ORF type:complete len:264 (+),score=93.39 TRINITY_DN4958_c1_g2_i1:63-794(+)